MKRVFQIVGLSMLATAAVLIVMGALMPNRYHVERSILIAAAPAQIHPWVEDLQKWPTWANWDRQDPSLAVTTTDNAKGVGASQHWQGEHSGSGILTITKSDPAQGIRFTTKLGNG